MDRYPAVAGQFYPGHEAELRQMVREMIPTNEPRQPAIGMIAPHAGYIYSGAIAGKVFGRVEPATRIIVLGPNHHGHGHPAAVYPSGQWHTPLGVIPVDGELASDILRSCPGFGESTQAHRFEHSLEVQIPFIQVVAPHAAIVPICLGHLSLEELLAMGGSLGDLLAACSPKPLLIASSDMTHYESGPIARDKDMQAIERVLALDPEGLYRVVRQQRITMCGVVPVVVMLAAARRLGAKEATLVEYGNSGDVTGDQSQVVGYAGVTVS